ncbi:MAG: oligosaccharide flippase family protein [Clostridium sp.]|nr:oligosaccharide flippase family protein [Clostridium sp.]
MNKENQLIRNTIIYAFGNFGSKLLTFILLPIYTQYLLKSEYGYFDLIVNTASLLIPIVTFQIMDGIYRFILVEERETEKSLYISNGVWITIRNIVIFSIVYIIVSVIFKIENSIIIYIYIVSTIFYNLWSQISRGLKKNLEFAIAGVILTIVTLLFNILFIVVFKFRVNGLVISYILGNIFALIFLEFKLNIFKLISFNLREKKIIEKLCKFSVPLIPNSMSWWMMNVSDRYMITFIMDASVNGLYAMANKFSSIIFIINSFFSLAWQESAIIEYNKKDTNDYYTRMFNIYMKLQISGIIVLLPLTRLLFNLFIKGEFAEGYKLVPVLYLAAIFSSFSVFYGTGYLSANDTKGSLNTTLIGAILNITINLFSIPMLGIFGAAVSTLISYLIVWLIRIKHTKKYFEINIDKKNLIILIVLNFIFSALYYFENFKMQIIFFLLSLVIFLLFNRELVKRIISILKKYIDKYIM